MSVSAKAINFNDKPLHALGDKLYADPAYPKTKWPKLVSAMRMAQQKNRAFFGELQATELDVIFCKTQACALYFSGTGQRGKALKAGQTSTGGSYRAPRPTIIIVKQGRYGELQLAHELNHLETHARSGNKALPSWFTEGLATYASGQPSCVHNEHLAKDNVNHLATMQASKASWIEYTNDKNKARTTYCQAAKEVQLWVERNGKAQLTQLLSEVKAGKNFHTLYGAWITPTLAQ